MNLSYKMVLAELILEARQEANTFVWKIKNKKLMASFKVEKPVGTQPSAGQAKKEPAPKASGTTPKAPASKPAPKKTEPKPKEPKKRTTGSKPASKN